MLKCLNIDCTNCKDNECKILYENSDDKCASRIIPRHTPSYAEEQLEYAKEKDEKVCYTKTCQHNKNNECEVGKANCLIAKPLFINYEEEYYKLKNENKKLHRDIEFRDKCFHELNDGCIELKKENKKLLETISKYEKGISESNVVLAESNGKEIQLKNQNQALRELIKLLL